MKTRCNYVEVLKRASSFLEEHGKEGYLAEYLLLERQEWTKTDLMMRLRQEMPSEIEESLLKDISKVSEGYPAQYVIGSCEFFGLRFKVTEATLIPRPETEELVAKCLELSNQDENLKVLDIGTGTGAIAFSLKNEVPNWSVTAIDISKEALEVASFNKEQLNLEVRLLEGDLIAPVSEECFDVVISNPPYIATDEWEVMDESVREYEPKLALFARNQGLEIYQRLANELPSITHSKSKLFFEIGYLQAEAVKNLFVEQFPGHDVTYLKDYFGNDRMVIVTPKN